MVSSFRDLFIIKTFFLNYIHVKGARKEDRTCRIPAPCTRVPPAAIE